MAKRTFLAIDMGASSGRHVAGTLDDGRLELAETYRFENGPVVAAGRMHWDLLNQWSHVKRGIQAAAAQYGRSLISVGVDTWGVDFALLGRGDELLGNPYHYRDSHTESAMEAAFEMAPREVIFEHTGLQFLQFNTLFQLLAMRRAGSSSLDAAERMLMMPDVFHWLLSGEKTNEYTNATTTQMLDPRTGDWSRELLAKLDLPADILGKITPPGSRLGPLRPDVAAETGLAQLDVVAPGTHDTASAVMAVPTDAAPSQRPNWCYISSGTWSLMGVETQRPVITPKCLELNFTNEGGVGGTVRLLKNIAGLWIVQECRRIWRQAGREFDFSELTRLAEAPPPLVSVIDPDDPAFLAPADMPGEIRDFCRRTGQTPPESEGEVIRCALEGLALKYRQTLGRLEELTGAPIETIHIVGGGTQNRLLCQMAADACDRAVVAGPIEATAIGNLMMQAVAAGDVADIAQARAVIRDSFSVERFEPENTAPWDEAFDKFLQL